MKKLSENINENRTPLLQYNKIRGTMNTFKRYIATCIQPVPGRVYDKRFLSGVDFLP